MRPDPACSGKVGFFAIFRRFPGLEPSLLLNLVHAPTRGSLPGGVRTGLIQNRSAGA
jgi:hypothetical protein